QCSVQRTFGPGEAPRYARGASDSRIGWLTDSSVGPNGALLRPGKSGGARTLFGVKVRFCGGNHRTPEKPGIFPVSCCEATPPIPHATLPRAPPESRRSTL